MSSEVGLLLGLDLTEVDRVAGVLERHGERFLARVFRPGEIRLARRHPRAFAEHVAGRFAAKEAAMKALGLGWRGLAFRDIEIGRDERGKPLVAFHGKALARARSLEVLSAEVSITHGRDIAAAVVALLTRPSPPAPLR
jgi:holo-[acyl-carrier protein] synthase